MYSLMTLTHLDETCSSFKVFLFFQVQNRHSTFMFVCLMYSHPSHQSRLTCCAEAFFYGRRPLWDNCNALAHVLYIYHTHTHNKMDRIVRLSLSVLIVSINSGQKWGMEWHGNVRTSIGDMYYTTKKRWWWWWRTMLKLELGHCIYDIYEQQVTLTNDPLGTYHPTKTYLFLTNITVKFGKISSTV